MKQLYLILAAMMLLCLAPMPYGYFQLVRFVTMVAFGMMAYRYYKMNKTTAMWVFGILALLFQPIFKISLGRTIWNVIDVLVAILLIALFVLEKRMEKKVYAPYKPLPPDDDNNKYEFRIEGKLAPNELVYVASEEDQALNDFFEKNPEALEEWGRTIGFHIVYLPLLMKQLAKEEVVRYRAPYLTDADVKGVSIGNDFLLQYLENPDDKKRIKQGFVRTENVQRKDDKDKAINRFYPLSSKGKEPLADQLNNISQRISSEGPCLRLEGDHPQELPERTVGAEHYPSGDDDIDDLIDEVKERISKLRQRGIAQSILEQLIHPDDRLSRLVVTKDYRLLLPDYHDMEIKMEPLVKAVYLLFLKHPEGIVFKSLPDYRQELTEIYSGLRPGGLTDRALQSIEDVTNPLLNSINEKCARIRGAFISQFDDSLAEHYYIYGERGEAKKIALPRDLVVWE